MAEQKKFEPVYEAAEVAKHNSEESAWVTIHGVVHDVTKYLNTHPGGVDLIVDEAGGDATEAFEDIGHGKEAREILAQHIIGYVPDYDPEKFAAAKAASKGVCEQCAIL
eukprot:INCI4326.1.p2 GENE.INCI4326.1~~INCI4326.1.p2  ORF type:complete len:126 (+),score=29.48 INCI4326.1:52-378(+)